MNNRINRYTCTACQKSIITIDRVEGVTPFMLACRATPACLGVMQSSFYRVPQTLAPDYEWYKPEGAELKRLSPAMREHVKQGGLVIRKITGDQS